MNKAYRIEVTDKIILVTGGYGHLGKAIVFSLYTHGAKVYVLGRELEKFEKCNFPEDRVHFIQVDLSKSESVVKAFREVWDKEGRIDTVINNGFYSRGQNPETLADLDWSIGIEGTLRSVFKSIQAIIPYYKVQGHGKIINVASMYGLVAPDFSIYEDSPDFLNPPHYGAAKAGVIQLTRYYASYLGRFGIQVNCITPGPFPSGEVQRDINFIDRLNQRTLLGRIGQPEDVAGAFVFLASDAANYLTGQNIVIDGGWTVK